MQFEELPNIKKPEKIILKDFNGDTRVPYERIKAYDDKEFELFIREWVTTFYDKFEVRGFGGAGDKGRDVIAKDRDGNLFYYQCKHYDHPLMPSDIIVEFGKLAYYTYTKAIGMPKEYYILAPHDIGPKLNDLLSNYTRINQKLITEWDTKCKNSIQATPVNLSEDLREYIEKFDFSIIKTKTMLEVVSEHKKTAFYAFRFGGGLTVKRDTNYSVPKAIDPNEKNYITKFLEAVSEKENVKITTVDQLKDLFPRHMEALKIQRERFFSAENLKLFAEKHLLSEEYYFDLCDDIFNGVFDFLLMNYENGYERMLAVLGQAANIDLQQNLLVKYDLVKTRDRQGICHQLANDRDDFVWVQKT